jgi:hypothetical protein
MSRRPRAALRRGLLVCLFHAAACALPVVSANTFLPAGDLKRGDVRASASLEVGRVLASPSDVELDPAKVPTAASKWEVDTWVASDVAVQWAPLDWLQVEGQLKLTNPIDPFTPEPVGGALGARVRLWPRAGSTGWAVEAAPRLVGLRVAQELVQTSGANVQVDRWTWRALGAELPLVLSDRLSPLVALTVAPFVRAYWIRGWHDVTTAAGTSTTTRLEWTPVFAAGVGGSIALQLGPIEIAPGCAVELVTRPGPTAARQVIVEPGLSLGFTF